MTNDVTNLKIIKSFSFDLKLLLNCFCLDLFTKRHISQKVAYKVKQRKKFYVWFLKSTNFNGTMKAKAKVQPQG